MGPLLKTRLFLARWLLLTGFAALLLAARPVAAVTPVFVDDSYVGLPNGTLVNFPYTGVGALTIGTDAFATIEAGVSAVASGGIVNVAAGNYATTGADLNKPLTLRGAQFGVDARGRSAAESIITGGGLGTFYLNAAGITIDGFKFTNFKSRTFDTYFSADDFTMSNCIFEGNVETDPPDYQTGAIQFGGGAGLHAHGFVFDHNQVTTDNGYFLVMDHDMDNGTIANNKFKCDSVAFASFGNTTGWLIAGNEFDGAVTGHGAYWGYGINADLGNVIIRDNNVHQMWLGLGQLSIVGGLIIGNTFNDNHYNAFMLWGSQYVGTPTSKNVLIQNNTINYNGKVYTDYTDASHGIWLRSGIDASSIHMHYNTFRDLNAAGPAGEVWAIQHNGSNTADARQNYWNPVNGALSIATQAGQPPPLPGTAGQGLIALDNFLSVAPITIPVTTASGTPPGNLLGVIAAANPGDIITIADGSYNGGAITVAGGVVTVNSGNLNLNGTFIGQNFVVGSGSGVSGNGTIHNLNLGGNMRPGTSPGTINALSATWLGGGSYDWEINDATGTAGVDPGWDLLNVVGALDITATSGSKFTVNVKTLTLANVTGNPANFDGTAPFNWTIATAGGGITGFDPAKFTVDSSTVPPLGAGSVYKFTLQQSGNDIQVHFEPNVAPTVANVIPDQNGTYGYAFNFTFAANTFADADNPTWSQTLTYSATGMPPGVSFTPGTRTFSGTPTTPVGTYPVTVTATDNGVASLSVNDTFNIVIAPAPLTITANNQSKPYGTTLTLGAGQTAFTTIGLVNGDTITSVTLTASGGTAPTDPVGGVYTITPSAPVGTHMSDYNITFVNGTLTVTKAPLNVTATDRRKQQGADNDPAGFAYTITGFVNSETSPPVVITGTPTITTPVVTGTAAGAYPINVDVTGMSADNYSFVGVAGTYNVMTVLAVPFDMVIGDRGTSVEKGTITLLSGTTNTAPLYTPPSTQYVISTAIKSPYEIDVDASRNYVVVDNADYGKTFNTFGVWRIEKNTLARTLISRGGSLVSPMGVKVATNGPHAGKYIVLDSDAFNNGNDKWGAVFVIDPTLPWPGNQTVVSSVANPAQGAEFYWPLGTAMALDGNSVYITDQGEPSNHAFKPARIFQVNLTTGARTVLFTATVGATTNMCQPVGLALESNGSSLVIADPEGKRLLRFTFAGSVLSTVSSTNGAFNAPFIFPTHVAIRRDTGNYIVTDAPRAGDGLTVGGRHIFEIDKTTGVATTLTTDGFLEEPRGVVIVP